MTAQAAPEHDADPGIDRKQLRQIRDRFQALNGARLDRARQLLAPRAQQFLDAVPLLFHLNHPALPGYGGADLPSGVCGFTPQRQHAEAATSIGRGFQLPALPDDQGAIHALFTMGSIGSLAQSRDSDFDIWLCAPQPVLAALQPKINGIQKWAANEGLAVTIFPVDPAQYRQGARLDERLDGEDCGSTQHLLLLDEFYRSHVLLAGRYPVWWLVPPGDDQHYADFVEQLATRRYLPPEETIDLGNVATLPEEEFLGASLWQLSKALDAPEKSLLKLMLIELHATARVAPLSMQLKALLHIGSVAPDAGDGYLLLFNAVARHLADDPNRLELARRCLVTRATAPVAVRDDWRREVVGNLAKDWQWPRAKVVAGATSSLSITEVRQEQRELQRQLERSHQLLRQLTARSGSRQRVSEQDLQLLEGRLRAQLERRAGKLERLPRGLRRRLRPEPLLLRQRGAKGWQLSTLAQQDNCVYRSESLVEVLAWMQVNRLFEPGHGLQVLADDEAAVRRTLHRLQEVLPAAVLREPEPEAYLAPAVATQLVLLVNPGPAPEPERSGEHLPLPTAMVSAREDSLRFSGFNQNLVRGAAALQVNAWGEVACIECSGGTALPEALCQLLDWQQHAAPDLARILATAPGRSELAARRVKELHGDISTALRRDNLPLYLFEMADDFVAIWHDGQGHRWRSDSSKPRLLAQTSRGRGLQVDHRATRLACMARLLPLLPADRPALLLDDLDSPTQAVLRDVDGSIQELAWPRRPLPELLLSLELFLLNVAPRASVPDSLRPRLWLARDGHALPAATPELRLPFPVQAIRCPGADSRSTPHWDLVCDGRTFAALPMTQAGVRPFAAYILSKRRSGARYPVHVTDIDLRLPRNSRRLAPYLMAKRELERVLAAALAAH